MKVKLKKNQRIMLIAVGLLFINMGVVISFDSTLNIIRVVSGNLENPIRESHMLTLFQVGLLLILMGAAILNVQGYKFIKKLLKSETL